eukprot:6305434-Prymnesium_polylepis.1
MLRSWSGLEQGRETCFLTLPNPPLAQMVRLGRSRARPDAYLATVAAFHGGSLREGQKGVRWNIGNCLGL